MKVNSLQQELTVRFLVIITIILTVTIAIGYFSMRFYLYDGKRMVLNSRFDDFLRQKIDSIHSAETFKVLAPDLLKGLPESEMSAAIINQKGNILVKKIGTASDMPTEAPPEKLTTLQTIPKLTKQEYREILQKDLSPRDYQLVESSNGEQHVVVFYKVGPFDNPAGLIQLSMEAGMVPILLWNQLLLYGIPAIFMLMVSILMVRRTLRLSLHPLYDVTNTIEKITTERLNTRLPTNNRQLEVDRLSSAFNTMIGQIEASFEKEREVSEQMRQFISDASHELRTPLTSISGFAEILLMGAAEDGEQLQLALTSIQNESERLTKLVQSLLLLTKLERQQPTKAPLCLHDLLQEMRPQLGILAGVRKVELVLDSKAPILGYPDHMKQVILNLFQNAVQHTDEEKGVIILKVNDQP